MGLYRKKSTAKRLPQNSFNGTEASEVCPATV